jgi:hypothetical protein
MSTFARASFVVALIALSGCGQGLSSDTSISDTLPNARAHESAFGRQNRAAGAKDKELLYVATGQNGINVYETDGTFVETYAASTGANDLVMDDSGKAYVTYYGNGGGQVVAQYTLGSNTPSIIYTLQPAPNSSTIVGFPVVAPNGYFVVPISNSSPSGVTITYDIWEPGKSGVPSHIIQNPKYQTNGAGLALNGDLYVPYYDSASSTARYDVFRPGKIKPSRTIVDTIAPFPASFAANWLAVAKDGTLYVAEYNYVTSDPNMGLYIYPAKGAERFVSSGAAYPSGLALGKTADVYVLNTSFGYNPSNGNFVCDSLHTLSVFSPHAMSLLSQASSGFENGQSLTSDATGNAFINEFPYPSGLTGCNDVQGDGAIAKVASGASSGTAIVTNLGSQDLSVFDGHHATNAAMQAR